MCATSSAVNADVTSSLGSTPKSRSSAFASQSSAWMTGASTRDDDDQRRGEHQRRPLGPGDGEVLGDHLAEDDVQVDHDGERQREAPPRRAGRRRRRAARRPAPAAWCSAGSGDGTQAAREQTVMPSCAQASIGPMRAPSRRARPRALAARRPGARSGCAAPTSRRTPRRRRRRCREQHQPDEAAQPLTTRPPPAVVAAGRRRGPGVLGRARAHAGRPGGRPCRDPRGPAGRRHGVAHRRNPAEARHHEAADGLVGGAVGDVDADPVAHLVGAPEPRHRPRPVAQLAAPVARAVVLVVDLADDLLDHVLEGDDARGAAVLVDDDGQLQAAAGAAGAAAGRAAASRARAGPAPSAPTPARRARRSKGTAMASFTCTTPTMSSQSGAVHREPGVPRAAGQADDVVGGRCARRRPPARGQHVGRGLLAEAERA